MTLETAVPQLQISGFGKLTLTCGQRRITDFPTRQVEELLGFLLINQEVAHGREKIIDMLWPLDEPVDTRGSLSTVLWRLRNVFRQLGLKARSFLDTTNETITFAPQCAFEFDVSRFELAMAQANSESSLLAREVALNEAIDLYQGDLYPCITAHWCLLERERLSCLHLRALRQLMYCCMEHNSYQKALDLGKQILLQDPLREEVYRAEMVCYANLGNRAQIAKQFKHCSSRLMSELNIMPSQQTIDTFQRLIQSSFTPQDDDRLWYAFREYQRATDHLLSLLNDTTGQDQI